MVPTHVNFRIWCDETGYSPWTTVEVKTAKYVPFTNYYETLKQPYQRP
jgi:hypothetical protein